MANRIVSVGCAATIVADIGAPNIAAMITLNIPAATFILTIHVQTAATKHVLCNRSQIWPSDGIYPRQDGYARLEKLNASEPE
jgi:hypothetical protein